MRIQLVQLVSTQILVIVDNAIPSAQLVQVRDPSLASLGGLGRLNDRYHTDRKQVLLIGA